MNAILSVDMALGVQDKHDLSFETSTFKPTVCVSHCVETNAFGNMRFDLTAGEDFEQGPTTQSDHLERIQQCTDIVRLDRWTDNVILAKSIDDVFH